MANFLMITATSGTNLELAERFAGAARDKGHEAEVVDLAAMELRCSLWRAQETLNRLLMSLS